MTDAGSTSFRFYNSESEFVAFRLYNDKTGFSLFLHDTSCHIFQDGESGWSSLHRAFHFGHLAVASILLQSGASFTLEDSKSRTPVDLLSGPVFQVVGSGHNSGIHFLCFDMIDEDI